MTRPGRSISPGSDLLGAETEVNPPHPAAANVSARAIAQASRKRESLVPSISSPGPQRRIELRECLHLGRGRPLREMDRPQLLRMFQPRGGEQLGQRVQGGVVKIGNTLQYCQGRPAHV